MTCLASYFLDQLNQNEFDDTLHNTLAKRLSGLGGILPEVACRMPKSTVVKFTEDMTFSMPAGETKFDLQNIIRTDVNEIKVTVTKYEMKPMDMIMIYGYFKNKIVGNNALGRKLLHVIHWHNYENDKNWTYQAKCQSIGVAIITDICREFDQELAFQLEGIEYINLLPFSTLSGLIDMTNLRRIENYKKQLTEFSSLKGLKGLSPETEGVLTQFLRSQFFWGGALDPNLNITNTDFDQLRDWMAGRSVGENSEDIDAILNIIHDKVKRQNRFGSIGGLEGFKLTKFVFFVAVKHFCVDNEFYELLGTYRSYFDETCGDLFEIGENAIKEAKIPESKPDEDQLMQESKAPATEEPKPESPPEKKTRAITEDQHLKFKQ